jgi:hypothetical protein
MDTTHFQTGGMMNYSLFSTIIIVVHLFLLLCAMKRNVKSESTSIHHREREQKKLLYSVWHFITNIHIIYDYEHNFYDAPEILILLHQNYNFLRMYYWIMNFFVTEFITVKYDNSTQRRQISKVKMYRQMSGRPITESKWTPKRFDNIT